MSQLYNFGGNKQIAFIFYIVLFGRLREIVFITYTVLSFKQWYTEQLSWQIKANRNTIAVPFLFSLS